MTFEFGGTLIASPNPADRCMGPADLAMNGAPIFDVAQFLAASNPTVFGREDGTLTVSFRALWDFDSEDALIDFVAGHRDDLGLQDDLVMKNDAGTHTKTLADAVREVNFGRFIGNSVYAEYKFTGSKFT